MAQSSLAFHDTLLSICLPTYNRAACIESQLTQLAEIDPSLFKQIEVIVSDNCSTDATPQVVERFKGRMPFVYLRNEENLGPDANFLQCLHTSQSKYVWLLGDDDLLQTQHLPDLLRLLEEQEPGLVHISPRPDGNPFTVYEDADTLLSEIGIMITFMSANIFLRDDAAALDYRPYEKTNLLQVPMYLTAALKAPRNVMLHLPFYQAGTMAASNGGYNLVRVFVKNFAIILDHFEDKGLSPHTIMMMLNSASDFVFPYLFNSIIHPKQCANFEFKDSRRLMKQYLGTPRILMSALKFLFSPKRFLALTRKHLGRLLKTLGRLRQPLCRLKETLLRFSARLSLWLWPVVAAQKVRMWANLLTSYRTAYRTATPKRCFLERPTYLVGPEYIHLGERFNSRPGLRIECLHVLDHEPVLLIGNDVSLNFRVHIGVANRIEIGNGVLIGSNVLITDHSHGHTDPESLKTPPEKRPIVSRGPVIIEDDVWIGENTCILQNVRIGKGSIIGAGAVITKDVPPYSKVAGPGMRILPAQS